MKILNLYKRGINHQPTQKIDFANRRFESLTAFQRIKFEKNIYQDEIITALTNSNGFILLYTI